MMNVELAGVELEDEWEENSKGISENVLNNRWFKEYEVYLSLKYIEENEGLTTRLKNIFLAKPKHPDFFAHFLVCSPEMYKNPPSNMKSATRHALVQDSFNEAAAIDDLRKRLAGISAKDQKELQQKLSTILFVLPSVL